MAYTLAQIEALRAALISGTTRVSYDGKSVEYRSLSELMIILERAEIDLGLRQPRRRTLGMFKSGA
jgi:hypothetical protein